MARTKIKIRTVRYMEHVFVRSDGYRWGPKEEYTGDFVGFAEDYTIAVIETDTGHIKRIPINDIQFIGYREEKN